MIPSNRGLSPPRIGSRSAAAAWALGTLLLGAGAVAVFFTNNAAGSVALIAAGTAFILAAAWRHLPSSIKAGGYELIWTAYETGRQQVVHDISDSVKKGDDSEDLMTKLKRLEMSYELERNAQMIELLKVMLEHNLINDMDAESLRDALQIVARVRSYETRPREIER